MIAQRQRIVEETDNKDDNEDVTISEDSDDNTTTKLTGPSSEALSKMTDYRELANLF